MRSSAYARRVISMLCAMYGRSRTSSFGFTMKLLTYQPSRPTTDVADRRRHDRGDEPADARRGHGVDERDQRADAERDRDDEHAGQRDVRFGVGDAREDRVIVEQPLEPPEVDAHREHQQHDGERDRQPAPRRLPGLAVCASDGAASRR